MMLGKTAILLLFLIYNIVATASEKPVDEPKTDFESLSKLLEDVGFIDIRRCGFQTGRAPSLEILDNRPEDSLYVEAMRP